jgi:hypothetical protein
MSNRQFLCVKADWNPGTIIYIFFYIIFLIMFSIDYSRISTLVGVFYWIIFSFSL